MNTLPLSIRDVKPTPLAIRLTGIRADGLPNGFHTGGAWLVVETDEVWKPLDGRPYANCEYHYPTDEVEALEAMAGEPLFPRNWRVEEVNGRRFLVRKRAHIVGQDIEYRHLSKEQVLMVEQSIREFNRRGWEVNDELQLGIDPDTYELFLVDLSTAMYRPPEQRKGCYVPDEERRIKQFFKECGCDWLVTLREAAYRVINNLEINLIECIEKKREGFVHVYASFNRPIDSMWADFPCEVEFIHNDWTNWEQAIPHTWIVAQELLDEEISKKYELIWGWSPVSD
jgi:hypothetical protein